MPKNRRIVSRLAVAVVVAALGSACGAGGGFQGLDETFAFVSLTEFAVTPDPTSARADVFRFFVQNDGTVPHEFLIVRTDLSPDALPTNPDGSYLENGPGTTLLEEIEDIAPGETDDFAIRLSPGNYVFLCNMVGPAGAHYALGMRAAFTAT